MEAFRTRLGEHGFVEGRNLQILSRVGSFFRTTDEQVARTLFEAKPDAALTFSTILTRLAQEIAGSGTPIVFTHVADPVALGLVRDLRRPGGNTTGVSWRQREIVLKRLELLQELLPGVKRVALAAWSTDIVFRLNEKPMRETAARLGFELMDTLPGGLQSKTRCSAARTPSSCTVHTPLSASGRSEKRCSAPQRAAGCRYSLQKRRWSNWEACCPTART